VADFPVFTLRADGPTANHITEIRLDDLDLGALGCVRALRLEAATGDFTVLHLELEVTPDVELPVELSAVLTEPEDDSG
jgi:hypothetical protein